jgi:GST-like protein
VSAFPADFPITRKWPAQHPDRIQLYSLPTPNGVKVSIALEEMGFAYEPHLVSFEKNDQVSPELLSLNPNNKIPAIIDPDGPGGKPLRLMFQMAGIGPFFGQVGFFVKFAGAGELVEFDKFANVKRVLDAFVQRPAVQQGLTIPRRD